MICVKENRKKLHGTIRSRFDGLDMEGNKVNGHGHIPPSRYRVSCRGERGHGREEKRWCQVYNNGQTARILGWENARSVVCLTRVRTCLKTGQTTTEKRYYITSLPPDSERIMHAVRTHWSIENNLHWQLDVTFNEDSRRKKRNAARNFSLLCKIALTRLKNNPRTGSPAMKRKMAGWDVDFLKELLDAEWQVTK